LGTSTSRPPTGKFGFLKKLDGYKSMTPEAVAKYSTNYS